MAHGCCQHSMQIRRTGSDWYVTGRPYELCGNHSINSLLETLKRHCLCRKVLQGVINDYAVVLKKVLPWSPKTVLEGGGNIGSSSQTHPASAMHSCSSILARQLS